MSNSNRNRRKTTFGSVVMRVAGVLLALTAVTVWATSFMFAKYTTRTNAKNDARVAEFDVDFKMIAPTEVPELSFAEGGGGDYSVTLVNKSETAVRSELVFDFSTINANGRLFDSFKVTVGTGENAVITTYTIGSDNKVTLKDKYDLGPAGTETAEQTVAFTLTFPAVDITAHTGENGQAAQDGWAALLALTENLEGLSGTTDTLPFDVFAVFTQID